MARIVKIRANPTPDPPDLGSGPDPGGRVGSGVRAGWPGRSRRDRLPVAKSRKSRKSRFSHFHACFSLLKWPFFEKHVFWRVFFTFPAIRTGKMGSGPGFGPKSGSGTRIWAQIGPQTPFPGGLGPDLAKSGGVWGGLAARSRVRGRTRRARRVGPGTRAGWPGRLPGRVAREVRRAGFRV